MKIGRFHFLTEKGLSSLTKAKKGELQVVTDQGGQQLKRALHQMMMMNTVEYYEADFDTYIDKGYAFNPHCFTVINFIGRNSSQVPFKVYVVKDKKNHSKYIEFKNKGLHDDAAAFRFKSMEEVTSGTLAELFKHPNEEQGWTSFMFEKIGYRKTTGNSYVYGSKPIGFDTVTSMFNVPSPLMSIVKGTWSDPIKGYKLRHSFREESEVDKNNIMHQKEWNPSSGGDADIYGMSPLEPLLRSLKRSNESYDANLGLLKNGFPAGVMSNESDIPMTETEVDQAEKAYNKKWSGGTNINKIAQSATKVSFQKIGLSSVDLQLLESNKADLKDFCHVYGIDDIIFDQEHSAYNNKITAKKSVWEDTLIPELNNERDAFNTFVAAAWSKKDGVEYFIDYDLSVIPCLQSDSDKLSQRLEREFKIGLWSPNECRVMLGKMPDLENPDMEKHYIDSSLKTIGESKNEILTILASVSPIVANKLIESIPAEVLQAIFKDR